MAGYLEQYGAGEERRGKIIKVLVISLIALVVIGGGLYFNFHNFREERQVKEFLSHLESRDYKAAYALFGCTDAKPCRYYPFDKFMEDWGPDQRARRFRRSADYAQPVVRLRRSSDGGLRQESAGKALGGAAGYEHRISAGPRLPCGALRSQLG